MAHLPNIDTRFPQWYKETITRSGLIEYSPTFGCAMILPYGIAIWERIQQVLSSILKDRGVQNILSPTPHGTPRALIYDSIARHIKAYKDFPLRWSQWHGDFYVWAQSPLHFTKSCRQEVYTAHANEADAMQEVYDTLETYKHFLNDQLAIPVFSSPKTKGDHLAGAKRTFVLESLSRNGKSLQLGTAHYLGTKFAERDSIYYVDSSGERQRAHLTSWETSIRLIDALIVVHGDASGLVLPPHIAPVQVEVIPVSPSFVDHALGISDYISQRGIRVTVNQQFDDRLEDRRYDSELRGVPMRIEVDSREANERIFSIFQRHTRKTTELPYVNLNSSIPHMLEEQQLDMLQTATKRIERTFPHENRSENRL